MRDGSRTRGPGGVTGGAAWFRPAAVARYGPPGLLLWISCIGVVAIVVCVVGLLTTAHPSTLATVAFFAVPGERARSAALTPTSGERRLDRYPGPAGPPRAPEVVGQRTQLGDRRLAAAPGPSWHAATGRRGRTGALGAVHGPPPQPAAAALGAAAVRPRRGGGRRLGPLSAAGPAILRWLRAQGIETTTIDAGRRLRWW